VVDGLGVDSEAVGHHLVDVVPAGIGMGIDKHAALDRLREAAFGLREQVRVDVRMADLAPDVGLDRADGHAAHRPPPCDRLLGGIVLPTGWRSIGANLVSH
jgi:hypothetical protein